MGGGGLGGRGAGKVGHVAFLEPGAVYVHCSHLKHHGISVVFRWGAVSCNGNEAFNLSVRQTLCR